MAYRGIMKLHGLRNVRLMAFIASVAFLSQLRFVQIREVKNYIPVSRVASKSSLQYPNSPVYQHAANQSDNTVHHTTGTASGSMQTKHQRLTQQTPTHTQRATTQTAGSHKSTYHPKTTLIITSPPSSATTAPEPRQLGTAPTERRVPPAQLLPTGLLVNSSACHLPDYDPWDATVASIVRNEKPLGGCRQNYPVMFRQRGHELTMFVNSTTLTPSCELECCYRAVTRAKEGKSDNGFMFGNETVCFGRKQSLIVNTEFVHIVCKCKNTERLVYEDFRAFIVPKPNKFSKLNETDVEKENKLNVYMIGLDSVSRLNFKRQLPELEALLEVLGAIPMMGLTKLGSNTLPNMLACLAGITNDDFTKYYKGKPLDTLPLVWKQFSKLGYSTMYTEDAPNMSTFNYIKKGFYTMPTDYYMRPLYRAMSESKFIRNGTSICVNQRPDLNLQLHWLEDLIAQPDPSPQFAFVFSNTLSHKGPLSYVNPMQSRLKRFLETYRNSERFNSSILFLFSDHGMRWGPILHTELGGYESRLPFFYVLLSPAYSARHPGRVANLRANSRRLTTFFDVHATLRELLREAGAAEADLPVFRHPGVSLFQPVPQERSCEDAAIPPHWCVCRSRRPLLRDSDAVTRAASAVVRHINAVLLRRVQARCAQLAPVRVIAAFHTMSEGGQELDGSYRRPAFEEMSVQLETEPGRAEFEATVRCWRGVPPTRAPSATTTRAPNATAPQEALPDPLEDRCRPEHHMTVLDVSRMNLYKGQSDCLKEGFEERLYCYCKDLM